MFNREIILILTGNQTVITALAPAKIFHMIAGQLVCKFGLIGEICTDFPGDWLCILYI